jgi:DNA-binding CsgD family transcriptional regulator
MAGNNDSTEDSEQEWRPDQAADYTGEPVLTDRQAETIATLDVMDSRESTAALLGITSSTVDDHRQDGQARAVAGIQQLRKLLDDSETIRQTVENAFRPTEVLLDRLC